MNEADYVLCEYQAYVLLGLSKKAKCGSAYLLYRFFQSEAAERIDRGDSYVYSVSCSVEDVLKQYPSLLAREGKAYPTEVMEWIGYITRCYALKYHVRSKDLLRHFSARSFYDVYETFHTLSLDAAAERIHEIYLETHPKESDYDIAKRILGPKYRRMLMNKK